MGFGVEELDGDVTPLRRGISREELLHASIEPSPDDEALPQLVIRGLAVTGDRGFKRNEDNSPKTVRLPLVTQDPLSREQNNSANVRLAVDKALNGAHWDDPSQD